MSEVTLDRCFGGSAGLGAEKGLEVGNRGGGGCEYGWYIALWVVR